MLRSIRPTRATPQSVSQPNGVDGGTARAVHELPSPPVRPRVRPKTELPNRPRAAKAADAVRGRGPSCLLGGICSVPPP
jgi:hypothetical protein